MKSFKSLKTQLDSTDTMPFGKYQGKTFQYILENDPKYLKWVVVNTDLKLSKYLIEEAITASDKVVGKGWSRFYDGQLRGDLAHYGAELEAQLEEWDQDIPF